ncbi:MAG TPA: hypothetical protein VF528_13530 [Pyrinomonadaceae bacterium]|jgi:uncharacterized protein (UPF0333 family)
MKRCPKCNRTYPDDNQKFCTVDGGRLETVADAGSNYDLGPTVITNQADLNLPPERPPAQASQPPSPDLNKTMASFPPPQTGEIRRSDTGPANNRTIAASFQPADLPSPQPPSPPPPAPPSQPRDYQPPPDYQRQQQPPSYQQPQPPPGYQQQPPPQQYQQQYQPQQPAASPAGQAAAHMPQAGHTQAQAQHRAPAADAAARKGSRLPLILGAVALLLLAGAAAYYFLVLNKKDNATANANANSNANTASTNANANSNVTANTNGNANTTANANTNAAPPPFEPPPDTTQFVNSRSNLSGKIAERFVPFSFYYPNSWELDSSVASGGTYFVRVERKLPPDFTQERLAVGWYESNGTYDADKSLFPTLVEAKSASFEKQLPGYEKVSEGPTKVNSISAYEFRFKGLSKNTEKGDVTFWGRIIFLPPGVEGQKNGLQLTILTSSLAEELGGIDDVGVKGELPVVLESFRLK